MLNLESYYRNAMAKCEELTLEIVTNTNTVLSSIKILEEKIAGVGETVSAATDAGNHLDKGVSQPVSLPAVMLDREMTDLFFSLNKLKTTVRTQLSIVLQQLKETLTDAIAATPTINDMTTLITYNRYQQVLITSIKKLECLEENLCMFNPHS